MTLKDYLPNRFVNPLAKTKANIGFAVGQFSAGFFSSYSLSNEPSNESSNYLGGVGVLGGLLSGLVQGLYYSMKDMNNYHSELKDGREKLEKKLLLSEKGKFTERLFGNLDLERQFQSKSVASFTGEMFLNMTKSSIFTILGLSAGVGLKYLLNNSS